MDIEEVKKILEKAKKNGVRANLSSANLRSANLSSADLSSADLSYADLSYADLSSANLRSADLSSANLSSANLSSADLSYADLSYADLSYADLSSADLSQSKGLLKAREWIAENFKKTKNGFVVYKKIGNTSYTMPKSWNIKAKSFIEDIVNPNPTEDCGCGVNFGTRKWCENNYSEADLWECLILFEDAPDIVVPYNTDGKARCGRLQLVKMIKKG